MRNPVALRSDDPLPPISSLIDVAFLLLIFFLVTTTLMKREQDLKMNIAPHDGPASSQELPMQINIDELGSVLIGSRDHLELVEPAGTGLIGDALHKRLEFARNGALPDELPVILDISGEASQQRVIAVLNTMAGLGIHQVNLIDR